MEILHKNKSYFYEWQHSRRVDIRNGSEGNRRPEDQRRVHAERDNSSERIQGGCTDCLHTGGGRHSRSGGQGSGSSKASTTKKSSAKTGDTNNVLPLAVMAAISAGAIAGVAVKKKKEDEDASEEK